MATKILKAVPSEDPNAAHTKAICEKIIALTETKAKSSKLKSQVQYLTYALLFLLFWGLGSLLSDTLCVSLGLFLCTTLAI